MSNQSRKVASLFRRHVLMKERLEKRRQESSLVPARVELVPAHQSVELEKGAQARYQLRISNHRQRDYTFEVQLEGVKAAWVAWTLSAKALKVKAGESVEVGVTITPPRSSTSRAGTYPLSFVVRAVEQPIWRQVLPATLTIKPYEALSMGLHQVESTNSRWLIAFSNESNQPLRLRLAADALDKKARSHFVFQPGQHPEWLQGPLSVQLPAGATTEIRLMVTLFGPPKRLLWPATHGFRLTASTQQKHVPRDEGSLVRSVQGQIKLPSLIKTPVQGVMVVSTVLCLLLLFVGSMIWSVKQYMTQQVANPPPLASLLSEEAAAVEWEPSLLPALEEMPVFVPPNMSDSLPHAASAPTITLASDLLIETDMALLSDITLSAPENENIQATTIFSTLTPTPLPTPTSTPLPTAEPPPTESPTPLVPTVVPTQPQARIPTPPPQAAPIAPAAVVASYDYNTQPVMTYEVLFQQMGAYYGLDWRLLAAVAYRESRLNPSAIGGSGEYGLMQIMPSTWNTIAPSLGVSDPFDPYSNVLAGTAYLAYLRNYVYSLGHSEEYWLLVAYNWGPNNVANLLRSGGGWGDLPYIRQKYVYDIFEELNQPNSNLWLNQLRQPVPRR